MIVHPVGKQILEGNEIFPRERPFRDIPFAALFMAMVGVLIFIVSSGTSSDLPVAPAVDPDLVKGIGMVWAAALCTGTIVGIFFVLMLRAMPLCMVWTCLLATPVVLVTFGLYFLQMPEGMFA